MFSAVVVAGGICTATGKDASLSRPCDDTAQDAVGSDAVSLWAEPSKESLKRQMREVFLATQSEIQSRTERARRHVLDNYTWEKSRSGTTPPA